MKILLVDDHILVREGLSTMLRTERDMQVVGEVGTVSEAIALARELKPDVILMDFGLPNGSGVEATMAILAENPDIKIIFLTIHDADERLFSAIRSGAKGYLLKNLPTSKVVAAIRAVCNDEEAALSRKMTARVLEEFSRLGPPSEPDRSKLADLTLREVDVLGELASDATNREIANRLFLSEATVKNHVHKILVKFGLKNRQEAARFARHQGLLRFSPTKTGDRRDPRT